MLNRKQKMTLALRLTGILMILFSMFFIMTDFFKDSSGRKDSTILLLTVPMGIMLLISKFEFIFDNKSLKNNKKYFLKRTTKNY